MGYAFISYSTKNQSIADSMRKLLLDHKIATWMAPGDIPPGSKYAQVVSKAIKDCSCVVLLLSEASQNSIWVAKEVERAVNYRKTIIPVIIEELVLNDEFELYLSTDQMVAVNKIEDGLPETQNLLKNLKSICGNTEEKQNNPFDFNQNSSYEPGTDEDNNFYYTLVLSSNGGSLNIHFTNNILENSNKVHVIKESEWAEMTNVMKECIAYFHGTSPEFVTITSNSSFEIKNSSYGVALSFDVSYIKSKPSEIFDSIVLQNYKYLSLRFFKKGNYIYHDVPTNSTLADIGLDEAICIELAKKLLKVLYPKKQIIVNDSFDIEVYSDLSGGHNLRYIVK